MVFFTGVLVVSERCKVGRVKNGESIFLAQKKKFAERERVQNLEINFLVWVHPGGFFRQPTKAFWRDEPGRRISSSCVRGWRAANEGVTVAKGAVIPVLQHPPRVDVRASASSRARHPSWPQCAEALPSQPKAIVWDSGGRAQCPCSCLPPRSEWSPFLRMPVGHLCLPPRSLSPP